MENVAGEKVRNKWLSVPIIATITRLLCRELTLQNEYLRGPSGLWDKYIDSNANDIRQADFLFLAEPRYRCILQMSIDTYAWCILLHVGNMYNRDTLQAMFIEPWPFGRPSYLGSKLTARVWGSRRKSSPDNAGHRRGFIAVEVLLSRVIEWLREKLMKTFGKKSPPLLLTLKPSGNEPPE